jgi:ATP-dependent helicase Lhr and Lhr-like helicase
LRRGYFLEGHSGLQFADPNALEQLRAAAQTVSHSDDVVVVSALDPVLLGLDRGAQAATITRVASTQLAIWRGGPLLIFEDSGARVQQTNAAPEAVIESALRAWVNAQPTGRRIVIERWNGEVPLGSPIETLLARAGFGRDPNGMSRYR